MDSQTELLHHTPAGDTDATPVAIFDLDGTLVDSAMDVAGAINPVLRRHGLPPLDRAQAAALMGNGLRRFAEGAFQQHGRAVEEADVAAFVESYEARPVVHSRLYPEVPETLRALANAGWRMVVCTNKAERLATTILQRLGILACFDAVCGSDTAPARKPDPRHLEAALARAGLLRHPAVMIGDYVADLAAARAYGVPSVFAGWGYGDAALGEDATCTAQRFAMLPTLLEGLARRAG